MTRFILLFSLGLLATGCTQQFETDFNSFAADQPEQVVIVSDDSGYASKEELVADGSALYQAQCASCHGPTGAGAPGTSIIKSIRDDRAITHTWQAMPPQSPTTCDLNCSTAVIAWVAEQNGIELDIQIGGAESGNGSSSNTPNVITLEPLMQTYQRTKTLFARTIPSAEELSELSSMSESELRNLIRSSMQGEGFRAFIKDGANDQLLFRGINQNAFRVIHRGLEGNYKKYQEGLDAQRYRYQDLVKEFAESPLELIYHVVSNERPYSEILTADYVMVSKDMAYIYETGLAPAEGEWLVSEDNAQRVSGDRYSAHYDWASSQKIDRPDAGILTSWAFTSRYPTTDTNRNRARAKQVMLHFLGYDIEASAPRLELSDAESFDIPTMESEACTVCHNIMDPIAGTFQNFGDKGIFNESRYGLDSLANDYKGSDLYETGDTWYADMLEPGYYGKLAPASSNEAGQANSIVWLAQQIVNDERFASGTVKFWWPAVFGRDYVNEDLLLIEELASSFRSHLNLKDLLVDMVMSDTYRYGLQNETAQPALISPEVMTGRYESLGNTSSSFADSHKIFFGGHDSWTTTKRERDINAVMVNVLKNNAYKNSCKMVFDDFSKPAGERVLFNNIELSDVAGLLKRCTTTPTPNKTLIDTTTRVDVTGQSVVTLALRGGSEVDSFLSELRVVNQNGVVVYDGAPLTIGNAGGSVTYNGSLDFGDGIGFRGEYENTILTLPALPQGTTELTITIGARSRYSGTDNAFIQIDVLGNRAEASLISDKIKFQLIDLVQMLWGETYSIESPEITALHDLFNALQTNAQLRGETDTEYGNIRCDGLGDQRKFDLDYTFVAWKGVIAAMLSDASFMLN